MVKARRLEATAAQTRRVTDLVGLAFFFAGAACLLALVWPQGAMIPDAVADFLRLLVGAGAFVLPVMFMFVGAMFLVGFERLTLSHSSIGSVLLFLAFIAWRHV